MPKQSQSNKPEFLYKSFKAPKEEKVITIGNPAVIPKTTPKNNPEKFSEAYMEDNQPIFAFKKRVSDKDKGSPLPEATLLSNSYIKLNHQTIRDQILKRPGDNSNKRYNPDSITQKSGSQKHCFLQNSTSEIPMSYRVHTDQPMTPYNNNNDKIKKCRLKSSVERSIQYKRKGTGK